MKKQNLKATDQEINAQLLFKIKNAENEDGGKLFRDKVNDILGSSNPKIIIRKGQRFTESLTEATL